MDVGPDPAGARFAGEHLAVDPVVLAWSHDIPAKVWPRVAAITVLPLEGRITSRALHGIADQHAETGLEGRDLSRLGRRVVDQDTTLSLSAEPVIELEAVDETAELDVSFFQALIDRKRLYGKQA